jgi:drug/metabolite transporter (DMT)-like permease
MFVSSALYALNGVIFKFFTLNEGFSASLFWNMVGQVLLGIILLIVVPHYRRQFTAVIQENKFSVLGLNLINGLIILAGDIVLFYALLLAPVTLVLSVSGTQPLFVFIFGLLLTRFFPSFGKEALEKKYIIQKIAGISIIVLGSIFIN